MHAKLFVELGVGVRFGLAIISTQLKDSPAVMLASSRTWLRARKLANRWPVTVEGHAMISFLLLTAYLNREYKKDVWHSIERWLKI
jgi:hypothetical protein